MSIRRKKLAQKALRTFHVSMPTEIEHNQNDNHQRSDGNRNLTEDAKREIEREQRKSSSSAASLSLGKTNRLEETHLSMLG